MAEAAALERVGEVEERAARVPPLPHVEHPPAEAPRAEPVGARLDGGDVARDRGLDNGVPAAPRAKDEAHERAPRVQLGRLAARPPRDVERAEQPEPREGGV